MIRLETASRKPTAHRPSLLVPTIVAMAVLMLFPSGVGLASAGPSNLGSGSDVTQDRSTAAPMAAAGGAVHDYHFASAELARPGWSGTPAWLAYDHAARAFYVAEAPSGVGVLSAGSLQVNGTIPVGTSPFAVAYDPNDGRIFVTNTGSNNVTAISDTTNSTIGSVAVGTNPYGIAFDTGTDRVYVANGGSNTVTVVNGSSLLVVATIPVGSDPIGVAYDPVDQTVVVANSGSNNVTVIDAATDLVVANPAVGTSPYDLTVDTASGAAYVSNAGSGNVSVLNPNGTGLTTTIAVGAEPAGLVYDSRNGTVWVDQGPVGVVVVNASTDRVVQFLEFDPQGAAYDPDRNEVCVTNAANSTFQCLVPGQDSYADVSTISFVESGLLNGTAWSVDMDGEVADSTNSTVAFAAPLYAYESYTVGPVAQYAPSPATGAFSADLPNMTLSINFTSDLGLYVLTFQERGLSLDLGSWWEVNVSGATYSTDLPTVALSVRNGSYPYDPQASGMMVSPPGTAIVNGSSVTVVVPFAPERFPVSFQEVDLPTALSWGVTFNGTRESLTTDGGADTLNFASEPDGSYSYVIDPVPGWVTTNVPRNGTVSVTGEALNVSVDYAVAPLPPNATYRLTFHETGLPNGTSWGVVVGSAVGSSSTRNVTFPEVNGTYGFVVLAVAGFEASAPSVAVVNGNNTTVPVTFRLETYPIVFIEFGLPSGTNWSVTVSNVTIGFNVTENSTTNSITFFLPNGTYAISFGLPAGYSGNSSSTQITVTGRASTGATLSVSPEGSHAGFPLSPWETAATFAVAGALAGVAGTLLWRRRDPPTRAR
ncbi:MAG: YncE family protein [Thermoplasmata archaeon]|nr:YncE family protein [Thermoplasmata archaeon]